MQSKHIAISHLVSVALAAFITGCQTPASSPRSSKTSQASSEVVKKAEPLRSERSGNGSATVYIEVAETFREAGNLDSAIENYEKAIALDRNNAEAKIGLAKSLKAAGKKREASNMLDDVLTSGDLSNPGMRETVEQLRLELDDIGVALREASDLLTTYAVEAEGDGRNDSAYELYGRALDLWVGNQKARKNVIELCKHNDWVLPDTFVETAFSSVSRDLHMKLQDIKPLTEHVPNDKIRLNETKWGLPIYNQGDIFDYGVWAPAPSTVEYNLDGRYKKFVVRPLISAFAGQKAQIEALEEELRKPGAGTAAFRIIGDGNVLYQSDVVTYDAGGKIVEVDVTGIKVLVLEATDGDGKDLLDFAVWAEGKLYM